MLPHRFKQKTGTHFFARCSNCGNDAIASWESISQASIVLSEFHNQWCSDCGDVRLEEFEITDPAEIARIDAARFVMTVQAAAMLLLEAAQDTLEALSEHCAAYHPIIALDDQKPVGCSDSSCARREG